MAIKKAKCPSCGQEIMVDTSLGADICVYCQKAFVVKEAIKLVSNNEINEKEKETVKEKRRNFLKKAGSILLLILQCIGYLIYCLSLVWLFIDITDGFKKK